MRTILLLLFLSQSTFAQVSGKLTTTSGAPIPSANVLLLKAVDSSFVKAVLTNEDGVYRMDISKGEFILRLSMAGYQTWYSPVFENSRDFDIQVMKENVRQLGEVVIQAEKPLFQQQPGGLVVNVESSILTKGSTALQVLERMPGVLIDYRNYSIALNGKNGVMVMFNGKLMRMPMEQLVTLLSTMSADNIEKIELLTTPPSKYDAEGSGGLINIVLKKDKRFGTNGTVSLAAGYGWREKGTAGINLAHNTGKYNVYGSYTFSHNRTYSDMYITSAQNMPVLGGILDVIVRDTAKRITGTHDVMAGLDVRLNANTTMGGSITYNGSNSSLHTVTHASYNVLPDSLLFFNGILDTKNKWKNGAASIYLEKKNIHFDMDYLYFNNDNPSLVQSSFLNKHGEAAGNNDSLFSPLQKGTAQTIIQVGVLKADYTKQLTPKLKMEAGIKGVYTNVSSLSGIESLINHVWVGRTETINEVVMKEAIGALYTSFNAAISTTANLTIGARYEYAYNKSQVTRRQGAFFPSVFFSWSEWQISYTKRISRPSYNDLASYVTYSDPTAVYAGNPFLKPTITHNIKLGYSYQGYSFSLLFSKDNYPIARYQLTKGSVENLLYVSPQNVAYQYNINLQANLPVKINNWWSMNYSFTGGLRQFKLMHTMQPVEKTYFGYSLNGSQAFKLPSNFSLELSAWYNSLSYNGSVKVGGFGAVNAGLKKELKNNAGTLQLSVSDLFRNISIISSYGTLTEEVFSIRSHVDFNTESTRLPIIRLTWSRAFGAGGAKGRQSGQAGDEKERVRKE
ncbi:TonB-dependent receptor [Chitinophaga sp. SYP-B3965]|uniref:outer membrane beta-barrel family protein n=1 Tax=Chitinophaga sp. SYP-B3965 TaxID=2663120 RepID=UPI0012999B74|nr:outer membrane beta-barrel family protein [Chitinophaga sp. SYP-B3965]MRG43512.1 TonB-dependent receptor [Chitinophaga sp. SYP-B3965]